MAEKNAPVTIVDGKYEVVGVVNPTTFTFEGKDYKFVALSEDQVKFLIVNGYPHLRKAKVPTENANIPDAKETGKV